MRTTLIQAPTATVLDWPTVKQHLRLEELDTQETPEQAYVMGVLVPAATRTAISILRRALLDTTYETEAWPHELKCYAGYAALELPWPNLLQVETVTYGGVALTEGTDYTIRQTSTGVYSCPGTLLFSRGLFGNAVCCGGSWYSPGYSWPAASSDDSLQVLYHGGYGATPDTIPECILNWILLRVGGLYEFREEGAEVRNMVTMPWMESLLTTERWFTFA